MESTTLQNTYPVPTPCSSSESTPGPSAEPTPSPSPDPTLTLHDETQPQMKRRKAEKQDVLDLLIKQISSKEEYNKEFSHYSNGWA